MKNIPFGYWLGAILAIGLMAGLGYTVQQHEFGRLMGFYLPLFGLYLFSLLWPHKEGELRFLFVFAILLRLVLLGAMPGLSDDIFRFIWDGRLAAEGYNPFDQLPSYYLEGHTVVPGIDRELFAQLNSQEYYTIYPPIAQATFALAALLFPGSILKAGIVLRLFLILCEIGSILLIWKLLRHWKMPLYRGLIYALNPLIIIEITGNLHYEGAMVFFLLLGLWCLVRNKWIASAGALALSVVSKLLVLMFFPFLIRRLGWRRSFWYFPLIGGFLLILFTPLLNSDFVANFGSSLDLYFRKFEFNASIYYLLRWIGFQIVGYNLIAQLGPCLALVTFGGILWYSFREKDLRWEKLPQAMLFAITLYLLLTTTVHPWYVSLPVVLSVFTRFRYTILWSGLIMLTYINYSYPEYHENLWIVGLEYGSVLTYLGWEWWFKSEESPSAV